MRIAALFAGVLFCVMSQTLMVESLNLPKEVKDTEKEANRVMEMPFENRFFDTGEQKEEKPQDMEVDGYYTDLEKRSKELSDSAQNNALKGYDVVKGEPYNCLEGNDVDPGLKHQIFKRGKNVAISKVTTCAMKVKTTVITTLNQYRSVTGSSYVIGEGFGFERSGSVSLSDPSGSAEASADWEVSADIAFSNSKSASKVSKYLTSSKGAIALTSATCLIDKVQLSDYHLPDFTEVFKSAVKHLASAPMSHRNAAFKRFVNTFGTHYITQAVLGARLLLTSFLTEDARLQFSREKIQECTQNSGGFNFFGLKYSKNSQKCSASDEANFAKTGAFVSERVIHSYGSMPATSVGDWTSQDFDPLPIQLKLKPIYELFEQKHLQRQGVDVDGDALRSWVFAFYKDYCTTMGFPCGKNHKLGCGYTDTCKLHERCHDMGNNGKVMCVGADVRAVNAWSSSVHSGDSRKWGPQLAWKGGSNNGVMLFHSKKEKNPWLRIKLNRPVVISYVTIINRYDCCGDRLRNLEIRGGMRNDLSNRVIGKFKGPGAKRGVYHIHVTQSKVLYLSFQLKVNSGILQINGIKVGLVQSKKATCPSSAKFAYLGGTFCCKYDSEKVHQPAGDLCDGSKIGLYSTCCKYDAYIKCPAGKNMCRNYQAKDAIPEEIEEENAANFKDESAALVEDKAPVELEDSFTPHDLPVEYM